MAFFIPRSTVLAAALVSALLAPAAQAVDLLQSYSAALNGNAQYLGALAAGRAGRESVAIAQAQLLPNITVNYNHFANSVTKKLQGMSSYSEPERYGSNSGALTLRQPLYRPAAWASYQRSLAMVAGADATQNAALQQLGVDVAQSYFDVLLAWETQQQLLSDRQAISAQLAAARKALSAGQGMRTDVDEAQARLDLVEARLLSARDAISQARRTLESQTNMPVDRVRALNTSRLVLTAPEPADPQSWLDMLEARNPVLASLRADVQSTRMDLNQAQAAHMPTIDAVLQRTLTDRDNIFSNAYTYYNTQAGVVLNVPLYAGGGLSARSRQAQANLEESEQKLENERRQLRNDVSKTFEAVQQGVNKVRALEQAEKSAQQMILSSERGFVAGTRTRLDILNARQQLSQVALELARERINYLQAQLRLHAYVGQLDEIRFTQMNQTLSAGSDIVFKQ